MAETERKHCDMIFHLDPEKVYNLTINSLRGNCCEVLTEATRKLGPHAKRSFARRINTDNPEVETFLESIGLRPQTDESS